MNAHSWADHMVRREDAVTGAHADVPRQRAAASMSAGGLRVDVQSLVPDVVELRLLGSVDLAGLGDLRAGVDAAFDGPHRAIVVDLSMVDFLAVCGVGVLRDAAHRAATSGVAFRVVAGQRVRRTLRIAGVAAEIAVRSETEAVVAELSDA